MEFAGKQLSRSEVQDFWQHSFMTGMLTERIAKWLDYRESEQAYLAGLLHDIGILPLLVVAAEDRQVHGSRAYCPWTTSLDSERSCFGMDHCEVGQWIGQSWNFFPSFLDVFENHHHPDRSQRDPHLVGMVAIADRFCEGRRALPSEDNTPPEATDCAVDDEWMVCCLPRLDINERAALTDMLENEYLHLLPALEFSNPTQELPAIR